METSDHSPDPLEHLLSILVDGQLTPEQTQELNERLLNDRDAQAFYLKYLSTHSYLRQELGTSGLDRNNLAQPSSDTRPTHDLRGDLKEIGQTLSANEAAFLQWAVREVDNASKVESDCPVPAQDHHGRLEYQSPKPRFGGWVWGSIGTLVALAAGVLLFLWLRDAQPQHGTTVHVAHLRAVDGARWSNGGSYQVNDGLPPGELKLAAGNATIVFGDGAEVTLQAPARFSLISSGSSQLHVGRMDAVVPESAQGFEVLIPSGVVVDMGTAFSVHVDDEEMVVSRIEVTQGIVTVATLQEDGKRSKPVALHKNQIADLFPEGEQSLVVVRRSSSEKQAAKNGQEPSEATAPAIVKGALYHWDFNNADVRSGIDGGRGRVALEGSERAAMIADGYLLTLRDNGMTRAPGTWTRLIAENLAADRLTLGSFTVVLEAINEQVGQFPAGAGVTGPENNSYFTLASGSDELFVRYGIENKELVLVNGGLGEINHFNKARLPADLNTHRIVLIGTTEGDDARITLYLDAYRDAIKAEDYINVGSLVVPDGAARQWDGFAVGSGVTTPTAWIGARFDRVSVYNSPQDLPIGGSTATQGAADGE